MTVRVVHRDAHLLVLFKPSGLPTTSPDGTGCLVEEAKRLDPDAPRLHASSRLDAEVTGLVTFARTRRATKALLDARARGAYLRHYIALAEQAPRPATGQWDARVAIDPAEPRRRIALPAAGERGQVASTRYSVRPLSAQTTRCRVLDLWPQTGRTHQLRVHAADAGCALLGDRHYGGKVRIVGGDGAVLRAPRVMLHCAELELPDPAGSGMLHLTAPVPDDMATLYAALSPGQEGLSAECPSQSAVTAD